MPRPWRFSRSSQMPKWTQPGHALRSGKVRLLPTIVGIALLVAAAFVAAWLDPLPPQFSGVAQAADGDSLRIRGDRIRLLGIDAPELDQICWDGSGAEWPCGRAAQRELARLVGDGPSDCQPGGTDKYGRTLAHCSVLGQDVGRAMVRAGLALANGEYGGEQSAAKRDRIGLWQGRFVDPRTWRDEGPSGDPGTPWYENLWTWFRELTGARTLR